MNVKETEILCCPNCGGENLHEFFSEVYERTEDSATGLHALVIGQDFRVDANMIGNPSPRRDGIRITFTCENCDHQSYLAIYQHKGQTLIEHK